MRQIQEISTTRVMSKAPESREKARCNIVGETDILPAADKSSFTFLVSERLDGSFSDAFSEYVPDVGEICKDQKQERMENRALLETSPYQVAYPEHPSILVWCATFVIAHKARVQVQLRLV